MGINLNKLVVIEEDRGGNGLVAAMRNMPFGTRGIPFEASPEQTQEFDAIEGYIRKIVKLLDAHKAGKLSLKDEEQTAYRLKLQKQIDVFNAKVMKAVGNERNKIDAACKVVNLEDQEQKLSVSAKGSPYKLANGMIDYRNFKLPVTRERTVVGSVDTSSEGLDEMLALIKESETDNA